MNNDNSPTKNVYTELRRDFLYPFVNCLLCTLHLVISCYITILLWLTLKPDYSIHANLVFFILDWHVIAVITIIIGLMTKRLFHIPFGLLFAYFVLFAIVLRFGKPLGEVLKFANNCCYEYLSETVLLSIFDKVVYYIEHFF